MYSQEITDIKYVGIEECYDLQVPTYENFILRNSILSHNCTGLEGAGKSNLSFTIAKYVDPTFPGRPIPNTQWRSCDRIVFTQDQFMHAVDTAKIGQAIVWDEAVLGTNSGDAMAEAQKILIKKMVTIRKKRLYLIFVIPSIFMLRIYFAVFRSRALIHAYTPDGIARGKFKFYSYNSKRMLFFAGKKMYNQGAVRPDFIGSFVDVEGMFFDTQEYDDKKEEAIKSITGGNSSTDLKEKKKEYKTEWRKYVYAVNYYDALKNSLKLSRKELFELGTKNNPFAEKIKLNSFCVDLTNVRNKLLEMEANDEQRQLTETDEFLKWKADKEKKKKDLKNLKAEVIDEPDITPEEIADKDRVPKETQEQKEVIAMDNERAELVAQELQPIN